MNIKTTWDNHRRAVALAHEAAGMVPTPSNTLLPTYLAGVIACITDLKDRTATEVAEDVIDMAEACRKELLENT